MKMSVTNYKVTPDSEWSTYLYPDLGASKEDIQKELGAGTYSKNYYFLKNFPGLDKS